MQTTHQSHYDFFGITEVHKLSSSPLFGIIAATLHFSSIPNILLSFSIFTQFVCPSKAGDYVSEWMLFCIFQRLFAGKQIWWFQVSTWRTGVQGQLNAVMCTESAELFRATNGVCVLRDEQCGWKPRRKTSKLLDVIHGRNHFSPSRI